MEPYSVLMSIYYKEDSTYFKQSLESILSQTVRTDDLVLVCDGPLTPELDAVIEEYVQAYPRFVSYHSSSGKRRIGERH